MNMLSLICLIVCSIISLFIGRSIFKVSEKEKNFLYSVEKCKFNKLDDCYEKICGYCLDYEQCPLRCEGNCEECIGKVRRNE